MVSDPGLDRGRAGRTAPASPDPAPARFGKTDPAKVDLYRYAADQTLAALAAQREELSALRTRTVQLMAFLGSATAFLAGTALRGTRGVGERDAQLAYRMDLAYQVPLWTAGVLAIVTIVMFASILAGRPGSPRPGLANGLRPWRGWITSRLLWQFAVRGDVLASYADSQIPDATFYRQITREGRAMELGNQACLRAVRRRYGVFLMAILGQLAAWVALALVYG